MSEVTASEVAQLVALELDFIEDSLVRDALRALLIGPKLHHREWEYGHDGEHYPCWTVVAFKDADEGIAYSQHGHGPNSPWGLVSFSDIWFGMDSAWFSRLEDAFVSSHAASLLSIWNVVGPDGSLVSENDTRADAFSLRNRIDSGLHRPVHRVVYRSLREGE